MHIYQRQIDRIKLDVQAMQKKPFRNFGKIGRAKKTIAALQEAGRDILNTAITGTGTVEGEIDRNNYRSYAKQVQGIYDMYRGVKDYGVDLCRAVVETRVAFISGEGLSIYSDNDAAQDFINDFLDYNKLTGSRLVDITTIGELEGKVLLTLTGDEKERNINVGTISCFKNKYVIYDEGRRATYCEPETNIEKDYDMDRMVYIKLGGDPGDYNNTTNRLHCILTEIENFSRAKFDLRKNTHVFGKYMPYWRTDKDRPGDAAAIMNDLAGKNWAIGYGYAGSAEFSLVEPSGAAGKAIMEDVLLNLKCISTTTGIPIHWFAWVELMSNRSTAETLIEIISAATKKERLVWEESHKELIYKAMVMAVDYGFIKNEAMTKDFTVKLPLVSYAALQQITDVWIPLLQEGLVSRATILGMLPGINPSAELKQIEIEKEEAGKNSPLNNDTTDDTLDELQKKPEDENDATVDNRV